MMEEWIEWSGGDEPVGVVEIRMATGAQWTDDAYEFSWKILDDGNDIIAYRIVKES